VPEWDMVLAPPTIHVRFEWDIVTSLSFSLSMLSWGANESGLHEWIYKTAAQLTEEQHRTNFFTVFAMNYMGHQPGMSFPEFIEMVRTMPPQQLRDNILRSLAENGGDAYPGNEAVLSSETFFLQAMRNIFGAKFDKYDEYVASFWEQMYAYLLNPRTLRDMLAQHLDYMWQAYLQEEWQHKKPVLMQAYEAFQQVDYSGMTVFEVLEATTGRNLRDHEKVANYFKSVEIDTLIFVLSPHIGPYVGWGMGDHEKSTEVTMVIGSRPPKNVPLRYGELSRNELLVRLNALADETRLKILELLTQQNELCAQDFINLLDLSQSSASRHLRQLTAAGYISERRRDVAKCYSLDTERIDDTIKAFKDFLQKP